MTEAIIRQNEDWLYERDGQGRFVLDAHGKRKLSAAGTLYALYLAEAEGKGIRGATEMHEWALTQVVLDLKKAQAETRRRGPVAGIVQGRRDARLIPNLENLRVAVIANILGCEQLSRTVLRENNILLPEPVKRADVILVVVRSVLPDPLWISYDSVSKLDREADSPLYSIGSVGHIYVYAIEDSMRVTRVFHSRFDWSDVEHLR